MKKLRVGFLIDNLQSSLYVAELINFVEQNQHFEAPLLITGYKGKKSESFFNKLANKFYKSPTRLLNSILMNIFLKIIRKIEMKHVLKKFPRYQSNVNVATLSEYEILEVKGVWSKSSLTLKLTDNDLTFLSQQNLDCIVRCGSEVLIGGILNCTKFGVIASSHGDSHQYLGEPSGFWEVLNGDPSSGFIIERLNQKQGEAEVLCRGNLMTSNLWLVNNAQLLEKSNIFFMQLLLHLAVNRKLPTPEDPRLSGSELAKPNLFIALFKYLLIIIIPKIVNSFVSILLSPKITRYSVAFAYHNNHSKLLSEYTEIQNPKGRFLADPFVFEHDKSHYIFVEDLFYKDNKGRISVIKIDGDNYKFIGVVLEEDFHLSFPFIFREDDEIYMIPESHENHDVRLYRCLEFPNKWELDQVLMSGVSAADTMLIKEENTWFMLTNICSAGLDDHHSELHIFFSNDLKSNSWQSIASGNPVIFDPLRGRNAGLFYHMEKIYRVNQVHGQAHYGKSFNVNEILRLSKNEYIEKEVLKVEANFKDAIIATHHFSANKSLAAVDFTRHQRLKKALKT